MSSKKAMKQAQKQAYAKHRSSITNSRFNSKNKSFLKKSDIYYRLNRLIDEKKMGTLFKVMLIKNKKNKFNIGFKN